MPPQSKTQPVVKHDRVQLLLPGLATAIIALSSTSLILFAYERALVPLYGSGPVTYLLNTFVLVAIIGAAAQPSTIPGNRNWLYAALSLSVAPNATYWVAVLTSRWKRPILGPAVTHLTVLFPLIFIMSTFIVQMDIRLVTIGLKSTSRPPIIHRIIAAGLCYTVGTLLSKHFWTSISFLNGVSEGQIFLGIAGIAYGQWILNTSIPTTPRKQVRNASQSQLPTKTVLLVAFMASWWSAHPFLYSPVLPHPLQQTFTHPTVPLQIHSSVQSTTGLIVVGEALPPPGYTGEYDQEMHSVRYLRASHSILGGVWMGAKVNILDDEPAVVDSYGARLGDSIYSAFVIQEAARLVNSTERGRRDSWDNALIIGLGVGTSATAFNRHGISTTIVEIDPAVYDAARMFFGLPDPGPGRVFLEDARSWASSKRASIEAGNKEILYDIVVHDCFSGGGVPEHIYTLEFWKDLKTSIHPEGIVVVNFAGVLKSDSSKMILQTLEKSFDNCRAFHDLFGEMTDTKYDTDFINMVLFCTQSKKALTFRKARKSDYLGSPLRRHVLSSLSTREVNLDLIRPLSSAPDNDKYTLTDAHNPLGKLQDEQGLEHWALMREVLPDVHWETY